MVEILTYLGAMSVPTAFIIYWLIFPEKLEIVSAQVWKLANRLPWLFRSAHKRYLRHDLQGRLKSFGRSLRKNAPYLPDLRPKVVWVDGDVTREAFLDGDRITLRLRRDDPNDQNFVHGSYMYVSSHLLPRAKRYVSPSHRDSLDLFVTGKLLDKERLAVKGYFVDLYVHPKTKDPNSKVAGYVDAFEHMHGAGLFYGVLLHELYFLGAKVFGQRRDDQIIIEVNNLINHLDGFSQRSIGDESLDPAFLQSYCRFCLVIIGKSHNLSPDGGTWINYIRRTIEPQSVETLYLLGREENREVVEAVADGVANTFEVANRRTRTVRLRYGKDYSPVSQYLMVLRRKDLSIFQGSE